MNIKRTWIVASATIAVAGFAGAGVALANDDVDLKDQQPAPVMQLKSDTDDDTSRADANSVTSADSADSARSAGSADSADSASDSPGYRAPAPPKVADSGNSPAPPPAKPVSVGDSVNSPAPPPVADSVDSPAPAKTYRPAPVHSGDSGGSSGSADSGD